MSKKAKIKTLEKMVKALRADVNKLKLEAATSKFRTSGATSPTTAKVEKSTASPKEPISTVRISAQR